MHSYTACLPVHHPIYVRTRVLPKGSTDLICLLDSRSLPAFRIERIKCLSLRYLLLVIYALFNMNDVSWGTREVPKSQADLAAEAENQVRQVFLLYFTFLFKAKEASKAASTKKDGGLLGYFQVSFCGIQQYHLRLNSPLFSRWRSQRRKEILSSHWATFSPAFASPRRTRCGTIFNW